MKALALAIHLANSYPEEAEALCLAFIKGEKILSPFLHRKKLIDDEGYVTILGKEVIEELEG